MLVNVLRHLEVRDIKARVRRVRERVAEVVAELRAALRLAVAPPQKAFMAVAVSFE